MQAVDGSLVGRDGESESVGSSPHRNLHRERICAGRAAGDENHRTCGQHRHRRQRCESAQPASPSTRTGTGTGVGLVRHGALSQRGSQGCRLIRRSSQPHSGAMFSRPTACAAAGAAASGSPSAVRIARRSWRRRCSSGEWHSRWGKPPRCVGITEVHAGSVRGECAPYRRWDSTVARARPRSRGAPLELQW